MDLTGDQERWQEVEEEERWAFGSRRGQELRVEVPHRPDPDVRPGLGSSSSLAFAPNPRSHPAPGAGMASEDGQRAGLQAYLNLELSQEAETPSPSQDLPRGN